VSNAAIVLTDPSSPSGFALAMTTSPVEARARYEELQAFVQAAMVPGVDFGVIPGTGNKPTLYQPGAQKLAELYAFSVSFDDVGAIEDFDKGLFHYRKKCILRRRSDGALIAEGVGSCNSREDKYAYRWVYERQVPPGVDRKGLRSKKTTKGDYQYRLPNEDICSLVNTVEKMACKRALVAAVICATRSSGLFTQDVEDLNLPAEAFGEAETARSWSRGEAGAQAPAPAVTGPQAPGDDFPASWQEPAAREPSPAPPPAEPPTENRAQHTTKRAEPPWVNTLRVRCKQLDVSPEVFKEHYAGIKSGAITLEQAIASCEAIWSFDNFKLIIAGASKAADLEKLRREVAASKSLTEPQTQELLRMLRHKAPETTPPQERQAKRTDERDPERHAIVSEGDVNEKTWPKVDRPVWDGITGSSRHES
jgi:hypothetical protein